MKISIKGARANTGLTQRELAKIVGVTRNTIGEWEKGISEPRISQAIKMSEIFNIPMENIDFNKKEEK